MHLTGTTDTTLQTSNYPRYQKRQASQILRGMTAEEKERFAKVLEARKATSLLLGTPINMDLCTVVEKKLGGKNG